MSTKKGPAHVVVDGSNLATEGRSMPSLAQLSEAVGSFMEEHPDTAITVVVDATFGHRIDKREVAEFEAGISNNELVAPPAGAVGRGDAFVLGIADKAGASVLSNDSFQEFHGEYTWLFDEGRLIGGKPVPHVGWVWVDRIPVRGPVSRKATRGSGGGSRRSSGGRSRGGAGTDDSSVRTGSKEAAEPMPTPKSPPPGRAGRAKAAGETSGSKRPRKQPAKSVEAASTGSPRSAPKSGAAVNELMPFLDFVEHHPVGTSVNGTVDAYSSHGAYITIGDTDVRGYVPLRLMADPVPRSAKSVMKIGESVTVVVVSFAPARRSIDCAVPDLAAHAIAEAARAGAEAPEEHEAQRKKTTAKKTTAKKTAAKRTTAKKVTAKKATAKKTAAKKTTAKKATAKKVPAKKTVAKKTAAKKTAAKKTVAKKTAAEKTTAKKPTAKKAAAKRTTAKKASAEKTAAKKTTGSNPGSV
jgi:hypothetical protein